MTRHRNDGLKKRCACPRRSWSKCRHPWHLGFSHQGKEYRWSLHKVADRPPGYWMSKTEAEGIRDRLRGQIREGTVAAATNLDSRLTFGEVVKKYLQGHVHVPTRRVRAAKEMEYQLAALRRVKVPGLGRRVVRLEEKPIDAITKADIEAFRRARRTARTGTTAKGGEVGTNRLLARLRHVFSWAIEEEHTDATPFKRNGVTVIHLETSVEKPRQRRLEPGEEARLLRSAGHHLYALIIAALETGCRRGELLSMQWCQVRWDQNVILLPEELTKNHEARVIPMSQRLKAVLDMRRLGPDGRPLGPEAHVFGNAIGEPVKSIKTAWKLTCQRAEIAGLRFHDLRREFASRLLEAPGVSGHEVRDWLGHANISTTSRYLSMTGVGLNNTLKKFEQDRNSRTSVAQTPGSAQAPARAAHATRNAKALS